MVDIVLIAATMLLNYLQMDYVTKMESISTEMDYFGEFRTDVTTSSEMIWEDRLSLITLAKKLTATTNHMLGLSMVILTVGVTLEGIHALEEFPVNNGQILNTLMLLTLIHGVETWKIIFLLVIALVLIRLH
eukprot:c3672_g1_i1.p2 GENE.c3672_g1_i1~~c3672_g1_i1.p2  ORF type:complete len:132 (+),score=7.62 c3672_g1_i1:578-973(+)